MKFEDEKSALQRSHQVGGRARIEKEQEHPKSIESQHPEVLLYLGLGLKLFQSGQHMCLEEEVKKKRREEDFRRRGKGRKEGRWKEGK